MRVTYIFSGILCVIIGFLAIPCWADDATEAKIEDYLKQLTFEEKILLLGGDESGFATFGIERLGIPAMRMSDGPVGVNINKDESTALPVSTNLAATWDVDLARQYGVVLAEETKAKGVHVILGPCICIHRFPLSGRNFENYGEDPYLTSRIAVPYIQGVQSQDVVATAKHYAVNDQEWYRKRVNVMIDERALREIHLPAFEAAVKEAGVYAVMSSYNMVNGWHASENEHLLMDILKQGWGFDGLVMSDWGSVYSAQHAANNGLDLEMPRARWFGDRLANAVRKGLVSEDIIDDKIRRQLRVCFKAKVFDNPNPPIVESVIYDPRHQKFARKVAQDGMVLLKNDKNVLPLDRSSIRSIAVIGPNATVARTGGGGSSCVRPWKAVSPFEGISEMVGDGIKVQFAEGLSVNTEGFEAIPSQCLRSPDGSIGLLGEYYNQSKIQGQPVVSRIDSQVNFNYGSNSPDESMKADNFAIRWSGQLIPKQSGMHVLGIASDDGSLLYLNGEQLIDNGGDHGNTLKTYLVKLEAGKSYSLRLDYFESFVDASVRLVWKEPDTIGVDRERQNVIELAKQSDAVIVCIGNTNRREIEGYDLSSFELQGRQDELVEAVASVNPRTIVVLSGGTPIYMGKWLNEVEGVIAAFYPGQEGGNALADLVFGEVSPSAKLPFSYIQTREETYAFDGYQDPSLKMPYNEGVFVGYRWYDKHNIEPLFEFGYGLSYTTFEYSNLEIKQTGEMTCDVTVNVKNTGKRSGAEVVQLYVSPPKSKVDRPIKELKAFDKIELKPGQTRTVTMHLSPRSFQYYDIDAKDWAADIGEYQVLIGASSRDIKLRKTISLKP